MSDRDSAFAVVRPHGARMIAATLVAMASSAGLAGETRANLTLYKTESSAACSGDQTVWVDPKTRIYYLKGEVLYAKTSRGGYNCRKPAEAAGYRASRPR